MKYNEIVEMTDPYARVKASSGSGGNGAHKKGREKKEKKVNEVFKTGADLQNSEEAHIKRKGKRSTSNKQDDIGERPTKLTSSVPKPHKSRGG